MQLCPKFTWGHEGATHSGKGCAAHFIAPKHERTGKIDKTIHIPLTKTAGAVGRVPRARDGAAIFDRANPANWVHALPDAHPGAAVRLRVRRAVGRGGRADRAAAALRVAGNAATISHRGVHVKRVDGQREERMKI